MDLMGEEAQDRKVRAVTIEIDFNRINSIKEDNALSMKKCELYLQRKVS